MDGVAGAHGVPHGGDALQGQARPVPRAGGRGAAPGSLPPSPLPGMVSGGFPSPAVEEPCPPSPCPVLPYLWARLLLLSAEGSLSLGVGIAPEALPSVAFTPGRGASASGSLRISAVPCLWVPARQPGGGQGSVGAAASGGTVACLPVLLLLPAVHAEEGPAEPHDQAARSAQAPRGECQAVLRALRTGAGRSDAGHQHGEGGVAASRVAGCAGPP